MAESEVFDVVCKAIETGTNLDRLEARGTVRISLKRAGLDANTVDSAQMAVVLDRVMPMELNSRSVENAEALCSELRKKVQSLDVHASAETPDAVFARLGGN